MGSGAMIYIPSFIKIGSGIQKLMGGGYTDIQVARQHGERISLFLFSQNKQSRLKRKEEPKEIQRWKKRPIRQ
jgi:hypothetical protein